MQSYFNRLVAWIFVHLMDRETVPMHKETGKQAGLAWLGLDWFGRHTNIGMDREYTSECVLCFMSLEISKAIRLLLYCT